MNMDKDKAEQAIAKLHPYDKGIYQKLVSALETGNTDKGFEAIAAIANEFRLSNEVNSELLLGFRRLREYFQSLAKQNQYRNLKNELKAIAGKIDPDKVHQLNLFED